MQKKRFKIPAIVQALQDEGYITTPAAIAKYLQGKTPKSEAAWFLQKAIRRLGGDLTIEELLYPPERVAKFRRQTKENKSKKNGHD